MAFACELGSVGSLDFLSFACAFLMSLMPCMCLPLLVPFFTLYQTLSMRTHDVLKLKPSAWFMTMYHLHKPSVKWILGIF